MCQVFCFAFQGFIEIFRYPLAVLEDMLEFVKEFCDQSCIQVAHPPLHPFTSPTGLGFVVLLSTLMCYHLTELILVFFFS